MDREKFTLKANEAIEQSVRLAATHGNQEVNPLHLAQSIVQDKENVVHASIKKIGIDPQIVANNLDQAVQKLPKVQGADSTKRGTPPSNSKTNTSPPNICSSPSWRLKTAPPPSSRVRESAKRPSSKP